MKKIVAIVLLAAGSAIAASAAQVNGISGPRARVSAPRDHTPTIHSRAAVAHK